MRLAQAGVPLIVVALSAGPVRGQEQQTSSKRQDRAREIGREVRLGIQIELIECGEQSGAVKPVTSDRSQYRDERKVSGRQANGHSDERAYDPMFGG